MLDYRTWLPMVLSFLAGTVLAAATVSADTSQPSGTPGVAIADLKQQLESGLKARLPSEFQFIARVVTMVEEDELPVALVKGTFQWARRKAGTKKYPFPYFERALRLRAAKLGIKIP